MDAHDHVLDGGVPDHGFPAAVDGDAVCHVIAVHDAAAEEIIASVGKYVVGGMDAAQTDHGFLRIPIGGCLEHRKGSQLQGYAFRRIGGGADGFSQLIHAVGKKDSAIGVFVNQLLDGIRRIRDAVPRHIIRYKICCVHV